MSFLLRLECINETTGGAKNKTRELLAAYIKNDPRGRIFAPKQYWVAEITGKNGRNGYKRKFLPCKKDWIESNDLGTRGVYAFYILKSGKVYEVSSPVSWAEADRYFCTVKDNELIKLTKEDVDAWLKTTSE